MSDPPGSGHQLTWGEREKEGGRERERERVSFLSSSHVFLHLIGGCHDNCICFAVAKAWLLLPWRLG